MLEEEIPEELVLACRMTKEYSEIMKNMEPAKIGLSTVDSLNASLGVK